MSTSYIYGVFKTEEQLVSAVAALKLRGFNDTAVSRDRDSVLYRPIDKEPLRKTFVWSGSIGAILGGLAGAVASPTVHVADTFQVLTPVMAMVAGAALSAYLGVWINGFLRVLDKPIDESEPLAGGADRAMILSIEADTRDQKQLAMECLELNEAVEIVVRGSELGKLESVKVQSRQQNAGDRQLARDPQSARDPQTAGVQLAA